jgi:cytochrome c oxidase subunit IV
MTTISGYVTDASGDRSEREELATGMLRYRTYWVFWSGLLALTLLMLFTESLALERAVFVSFLVGAMLLKAGIIAAWFMHLRFERASLVVSVVGATLLTAVALYVLIAPDGVATLRNAAP